MKKYKVCNRFLEIRLKKGYRFQKDFAEFLEMERQEYNKLENNKKPLTLKRALIYAPKLGVTVEELCYLKELEPGEEEDES